MSVFPYRWLPRTVIPNIMALIRNIKNGVCNVIRWTPVIWGDFDWDWEPFAEIMEYKLRRISDCLKDGCSVGSESHARQALICAELLKRLKEDSQAGVTYHQHTTRMREWDIMFGKTIGKHLRCWWD